MAELIASGSGLDVFGVAQYDSDFAEGDSGVMELDLSWVPPGTVSLLQVTLNAVPGWDGNVSQINNTIFITFSQGALQLVIIAVALAVVFVGAVLLLLIAWRIFKELGVFGPLVVAGVVAVVLVALVLALGGSNARVT